ncbi:MULTISPECIES: relaxase domain-containing protein [Glycomyces]|uniref:Relaxase domain-containing protein n=2 Tax=Glycomyces TaxID=58113 RepID=A0A9X3SV58_9ACTN|nr:relaxase domain-containing protein [Glycomyces lechevalierae]MDA1384347.1 relaxase domain-containing protein [Glycomyces lechevalierae]MDR7339220.1 hypothetical protein [Glycomyces lechevalierae]
MAGYDLVFAPVKSAAMLWGLHSSRDVRAQVKWAHDAAVAEAMKYLEQHAAFTRVGAGGPAQVDSRGLAALAGRIGTLLMTEYVLRAELALPEGHPDLNPLENVGATTLIDTTLDRVGGAETEDGESIDLVRHWVGGHPQGALLLFVIDAPTPEDAEGGAEAILYEVLEENEPLEDWQVTKCEVNLNEEEFKQKLANPGTDPERSESRPQPPSDDSQDMASERDRWVEQFRTDAKQLRAFNIAKLSDDTITAESAAGALIWCTSLVLEDLFQGLEELSESGGTAEDADDTVLWQLPERFREHYTALFVKHMITAAVTVSNRLAQDEWQPPSASARRWRST